MEEYFIDVLPDESRQGTYRVVLIPMIGRHGGMPTLGQVRPEPFLNSLQNVLGWTDATLDRLRRSLTNDGVLSNERIGSPTKDQLQRLGFDLSAWN